MKKLYNYERDYGTARLDTVLRDAHKDGQALRVQYERRSLYGRTTQEEAIGVPGPVGLVFGEVRVSIGDQLVTVRHIRNIEQDESNAQTGKASGFAALDEQRAP